MGNFKENKTKVSGQISMKVKKEFFLGEKINHLAKKYGYNYLVLEKFLNGKATTYYTNKKGIKFKRCNNCRIYKTLDNFYKINIESETLHANCRNCYNLIQKNRKTEQINIYGKKAKILKQYRKTWYKNKWKYNIRRKIMRVIGYIDNCGRVIKKTKI